MIPDDELAPRRIAKAIARLVAQVSQHGATPDVVVMSRAAADEMGVDWRPAEESQEEKG